MAQDIYSSVTVHGDLTADNLHGTVDIANKAKGMIVVNAQTTETLGQWVATVPEITELYEGLQICLVVPEEFYDEDAYPMLSINSGSFEVIGSYYLNTLSTGYINLCEGDYVPLTYSYGVDGYSWFAPMAYGYVSDVSDYSRSASSGQVSQQIWVSIGNIAGHAVHTAKYYTSTGQNTDGAMTQKAITDALENAGGGLTITTYPAD